MLFVHAAWQYRCALIGFENIVDRHTAENIFLALDNVTQSVGLSPTEQVAGICSDSGSDILAAGKKWQAKEYQRYVSNSEPLRFNEGYFMIQLPCFAHHIHNAMKKAMNEGDGISNLITKWKNLGNWVRNSMVLQKKLHSVQRERGLNEKLPINENETRWHSTNSMLDRIIDLRPALQDLVEDVSYDKSLPHRERYNAWTKKEILDDEAFVQKAKALNNLLSQVRRYARLLESQEPFSLTYVLLVYALLCKVLLVESVEEDSGIKDFKKIAREYLEARIKDQNLGGSMVCCALDPRFLKPEVVLGKDIPAGTAEKLRDWLAEFPLLPLLRTYVRSYWTRHLDSVPHQLTREDLESNEETETPTERNRSIFGRKSESFTDLLEQELKTYRWNAEREHLEPLEFWRKHQDDLKLLSGAAKLLLPFPASSAPAERTFSIAGWTQHKLRKRMTPETLKDLLFLKHCWLGWLDASKHPPMTLETDGMDCEEADIEDAADPSSDQALESEDDERTVVIEEE